MAVFTRMLNKGAGVGITPGTKEAREWFRQSAMKLTRANELNIINASQQHASTFVRPGYMYIYMYDAKHKETLPYWDMFPLVFPFHADGDGFLGMNMHYIPPRYRAVLMDRLYDLSTKYKDSDRNKLRMSYDLLNGASQYKYFKPCVKRYLYSQLRSKFILIPQSEWDIALFLPMGKFQKAGKLKVYQDSVKAINK